MELSDLYICFFYKMSGVEIFFIYVKTSLYGLSDILIFKRLSRFRVSIIAVILLI